MAKRQKVMAVDDRLVDSFIEIDRISVGHFEEATSIWGIDRISVGHFEEATLIWEKRGAYIHVHACMS